MANVQRYATIAELQERLTSRAEATSAVSSALAAASTAVETYCHRVFTLDAAASARVYVPTSIRMVLVDDIGAASPTVAIGTDGVTFPTAVADVWFGPDNALARGRPIEDIRSNWLFPMLSIPRPTVQVTARWGWPSVPDDVREAVLLLASRLYTRRDSPTGVAGFGDMGVVRVTSADADVAAMLGQYVRSTF